MGPHRIGTMRNILMELRKTCQHPYLSAPELENEDLSPAEQHKQLTATSGKLQFLKILLPKLKQRGHRVLLFSQFKIALDFVEDFLSGEGYKFLRLDGDVKQAQRQKSMDAFNAPDSDYFIFLLTTRAGGVGINLATADTVIIFDPDFNPHQDLQAIARSHRYGQHKRVLVFKLMIKSSVEERIIWQGKKKMVLDHLVVQQMGKETEEGDIDTMLLHGAETLYDTDEQGRSASDIIYTERDVEDMIDKVEADAEAEAKRLEERDRAASDGQASNREPDPARDKEKEKSLMNFSFAKVWEREGTLQDLPNDDDDEGDQGWQLIFENAQKERERLRVEQAAEFGVRHRAAADKAKQRRIVDVDAADGTADPKEASPSQEEVKKKRKPYRRKKNGKDDTQQSEDDFDPTKAGEESSEDEIEDLIEMPDLGVVGNGGPSRGVLLGKGKKPNAPVDREVHTARAELLGGESENAPDSGSAVAGPSSLPYIPANGKMPKLNAAGQPETAAERKQRKQSKKLLRMSAAVGEAAQIGKALTIAPPGLPSMSPSVAEGDTTPLVDADKAARGKETLKWMWRLYSNQQLVQHQLSVLRVMSTQLVPQARISMYFNLATFLDRFLTQLNQPAYFLRPDQVENAVAWIRSGQMMDPTIQSPFTSAPPGTDEAGKDPKDSPSSGNAVVPALSETVSASEDVTAPIKSTAQEDQAKLDQAVHDATAVVDSQLMTNGLLTPPRTSGQQMDLSPQRKPSDPSERQPSERPPSATEDGVSLPTESAARPPVVPENNDSTELLSAVSKAPDTLPDPPSPVRQRSTSTESSAPLAPAGMRSPPSLSAIAIPTPTEPTPSQALREAASASPHCTFCRGEHSVRECSKIPKPEKLAEFRRSIVSSKEPDSVKRESLAAIEHLMSLHIAAANTGPANGNTKAPTEPGAGPASVTAVHLASDRSDALQTSSMPSRAMQIVDRPKQAEGNDAPGQKRSRSNKSSQDVIVVDDDDEAIEIATRPNKRTKTSESTTTAADRPARSDVPVGGCAFCLSAQGHKPKECPVVRGGPDRIKQRLDELEPSDPLYSAIKQYYDNAVAREARVAFTRPSPPPMPLCAFCKTRCGRSIRECAEKHGGRKELKNLIRELDGKVSQKWRAEELFACYQNWPKSNH